MPTVRRPVYPPEVAPVTGPAAPGPRHSGGTGFAASLHAAAQEAEQTEDSVRAGPVRPAELIRPVPGPLIVAGIVVPAGLPR